MNSYITRITKSKNKDKYNYEYFDMDNKKLNLSIVKSLLSNLYIPPAYKDVKINLNKNEKILSIGYDDKNIPQYI